MYFVGLNVYGFEMQSLDPKKFFVLHLMDSVGLVITQAIPTHRVAQRLKMEKKLKDFEECHENSLIESFKMSPHLICLS